jgi:glyoxylase-like metal-dependent hydrolase (beta-lactamase superfamily II)
VTIVYGEGDWPAVLARSGPHATRFGPQNDGTDGRVIQVGDVSVQIVTTPGHTPGTMSYLFEFRDKGESLRVAYQGGTAFSFTDQNPAYYDQFLASTRKFTQLAAAYGADTLMSNHTTFDMAYIKSHTALALRALHGDDKRHSNQFYSPSKAPTKPDGIRTLVSNPFYVGQRRVLNYLGTYELCTMAAKLRATGTL